MSLEKNEYIKGRGAQIHTKNKFLKQEYVTSEIEGIDEEWQISGGTQYYIETPKKIINKVTSPDLPLNYSMNPYQGCEHGCIYCYARNTHEYYGFSAGLDFESKIMIKENAAEVLRNDFKKKSWIPGVIMLAGNTDCYQPIEKKYKITRKILEVCLDVKNPVSIITKNSLILRDIDILEEMMKCDLVHVNVSITTLDESIRQKMEPRTTTAKKRLEIIEKLSALNIPTRVMAAPMIPFINSKELPQILKAASEHGALDAGYTLVRLNGSIGEIFEKWIYKAFPEFADRVLSNIKSIHDGKLNDSRFGNRMKGSGKMADVIAQLYRVSKEKYYANKIMPKLDFSKFNSHPEQLLLF